MFSLSTVIASCLVGSLSFVVIMSEYYGMTNPRTYGSGNPDAINMLRSGKKKAAALTLLSDALKGAFAAAAARLLQDNLGLPDGIITITAVAVLAGHMWPVFFGFKGGEGVATTLDVPLALSWLAALICAAIWSVVAFGFKVSSLTALAATVINPFIACLSMPHGSWVAATVVITALIPYHHKSNIENLLQGKEDKIGDKAGNQPWNPNHEVLS